MSLSKYLLLALCIFLLHIRSSHSACTTSGAGCTCTTTTLTTCTACSRTGSDYSYVETLSPLSTSGLVTNATVRTITINGCPNHAFTDYTPSTACKGTLKMTIPALPRYMASTTNTLASTGSAVGILFDGATVYSAFGGSGFGTLTSYSNSAPYAEGYSFDQCSEHSSGTAAGAYHAHVPPSCLLNQLNATSTSASPRLGYMMDGFPIYGPRGPNGVYMKVCGKAGADSKYCTDSCGGYYDASQTVWADGYVYRYFIMGPYNGISDICATDLWRAGVYGANGVAVSGTAFSSCNNNFAASFYPFTPLCLRGCVPSNVGTLSNPANSGNTIYCKDLTTSTSKGYTDVTKIKTTAQLPLNPYRSQLATCLANDCKLVSGTYYQPNPNACSHNATTGAYLYNPTATPTKAPTGSSPTTTVPISSLPPTRAPSASRTTATTTRGPTVVPTSVTLSTRTSASPSIVPTKSLPPTRGPSVAPSTARPPTTLPTTSRPPTRNPSVAPTSLSPTIASRPPTRRPSIAPSTASVSRPPTRGPSVAPTSVSPTIVSRPPTRRPSVAPSVASVSPTAVPTTSRPPTRSPSATPFSASPTIASRPPTRRPSVTPTAASRSPSRDPSVTPAVFPTKKASSAPSVVSSKSSVVPSSGIASKKPTGEPTVKQSAPPPKLPGQVAI